MLVKPDGHGPKLAPTVLELRYTTPWEDECLSAPGHPVQLSFTLEDDMWEGYEDLHPPEIEGLDTEQGATDESSNINSGTDGESQEQHDAVMEGSSVEGAGSEDSSVRPGEGPTSSTAVRVDTGSDSGGMDIATPGHSEVEGDAVIHTEGSSSQ